MMDDFATTPFGGGRIGIADFRRREAIEKRRASVKEGGNDTGRADKWQLLRALSEAREALDLSDRTIVVLHALLSFHQARELDGSEPIVVFPSNAELSLRSHGMADATLRRHLAALVKAGLILRRDSPNGKRYCRRDARGVVADAFGFDLSPLALAANDIYAAAEAMREEADACRTLRSEITIHLRDTGKIIEAAIAEKRAGDWQGFMLDLVPLARRLHRGAERALLERRRDDLIAFRARVEKAYLDSLEEQEMSGNDVDSERHYQNSKPDHHFEYGSEKELKRAPRAKSTPTAPDGLEIKSAVGPISATGGENESEPVPLAYLLGVCPSLASYARDGIASWREVLMTAGLVRSMLGISPDAWRRATDAMGDIRAAITVSAILERAENIRSPGGYLRALTERAERGEFSVKPMLAALEGGREELTKRLE